MVLATLGDKPGEVKIENFAKNEKGTILAHKSTLSAIAMNASGTRLATTSEKGTLVRVWDISKPTQPTQLIECRRGMNH